MVLERLTYTNAQHMSFLTETVPKMVPKMAKNLSIWENYGYGQNWKGSPNLRIMFCLRIDCGLVRD